MFTTPQSAGKTQNSTPGTFATGKGTTGRLLQYLRSRADEGNEAARTAEDAGVYLGLPSRQIIKRLSEQVKKGTIKKIGKAYIAAELYVAPSAA